MSNPEENQNPNFQPPKELIKPNFLDKFFVVVTASGFGLGTVIALVMILLPNIPFVSIIPSIFFGTGIGALVYRFMGGFQQNDSLLIQGIKISGSLASLLGTMMIIDHILNKQLELYRANHLILNKAEERIYVGIKNKEINLGELHQKDFNDIDYYDINHVSIVSAISNLISSENEGYNHPVVEKIRTDCSRKQGICEPPKKLSLIIYDIKPETDLPRGEAITCYVSEAFWKDIEYLSIYKPSGEARRIRIQSLNGDCSDEEGPDRKIIISQDDADYLQLKRQDKVKASRIDN